MANPTTNYGFVLPTSSDLVTDLPADFDVALQGVDTRLKALQPGTTLGDLAYSSATANTNTRLPIGTTGQVLTVSGGVPTWQSPAGGGKILQVKNATFDTLTLVSQNTDWVDSGLTISITPTSASSKILIFANMNGLFKTTGHPDLTIGFRLLRNSTNILNFEGRALYTGSEVYNAVGSSSTTKLDEPATTSATTYKVQMINYKYSSYVAINNYWAGGGGNPAMYSASSITVMEVGA